MTLPKERIAKYLTILLLLVGAWSVRGQEGFNASYLKPMFESGPKPLNGRKATVLLTSWDEGEENNDKARLMVYIDMPKELPDVRYEEIKTEILEETGNAIERIPTEKNEKEFSRIHDSRCGVYWLKLKKGQKVETVRITWKDSVQTFLISKAQVIRPSIET